MPTFCSKFKLIVIICSVLMAVSYMLTACFVLASLILFEQNMERDMTLMKLRGDIIYKDEFLTSSGMMRSINCSTNHLKKKLAWPHFQGTRLIWQSILNTWTV